MIAQGLKVLIEEADRCCREFRFELPTETPPSGEQTAKMAV